MWGREAPIGSSGVLRMEVLDRGPVGKRLVFAYVLPLVVFFLVDLRLFSFHRRKEDVGTVRSFLCVVFFCVTMLLGGTRVLF